MPTYEFERKDGIIIEEIHSINNIPNEIVCEDGQKAKRIISAMAGKNVILKGPGDHWPTQQLKRKNEMTKKNEDAGKRGEKDWRERMPKLVDQS